MDAGEDFTGGDGNDIFNAFAVQTALLPNQTLNGNDFLIGGGGRDTLNVELVNLFTQPAGLESIEVVNVLGGPDLISALIGTFGAPSIFDVINADSIDTLGFRAPVNSIIIDNLSTALDTINIADSTLGKTYTVKHIGNSLALPSQDLDINLSNVTSTILPGTTTTLDLIGNGAGDSYETANIDSGGSVANTFILGGVSSGAATAGAFTTINVSGAQNLSITGSSLNLGSLETFDARALNADLDATFSGGGGGALFGAVGDTTFNLNATGGDITATTYAGDDTIIVATHAGDITVDAGEGSNTVDISNVTGSVKDAKAGSGDDTFIFNGVTGTVDVDGGDGRNTYSFETVGGAVTAAGGDGVDTFTFVSTSTGEVTFTDTDSVDGGGGEDVLIIQTEASAVDRDLLVAGVGPNIVDVETIRHEGTFTGFNDLNVDMSRSGDATRLELAGNYSDDVRVEGLNHNVGDVVVVLNNIGDELELTQASLTPGAYNLELGGAGVTIGELIVGDGLSDLITVESVGAGPGVITDVSRVDAQVEITGDADIQFGSASGAYELDNGVIDTTGFDGKATVFLGDDQQTFVGGDGDDVVWSMESNWNDNNTIELGDGVNTVGFVETAAGQNITNQHHVTGFTVGVDKVDLYVGAGGFTLDATDNGSVSAGDALNIETISKGQLVNLSGSDVNFLKFTESVSGETTVDGLFDAAIGGGRIDLGFASGADVLGAAYDEDSGSMVIFQIDNSGLGSSFINANDTAEGIASIEMTHTEFMDFGNNSEDLSFVNSYA